MRQTYLKIPQKAGLEAASSEIVHSWHCVSSLYHFDSAFFSVQMIIWTIFSACRVTGYLRPTSLLMASSDWMWGVEGLSFTCQLLNDNQASRLLSPQCLGFELISCLTWTFDTTQHWSVCFNHLECCQRIETDSRNASQISFDAPACSDAIRGLKSSQSSIHTNAVTLSVGTV